MQAFDDLLRQGLMEANLIEYTSELDNLPGPDFSPKYRRGRKRLLANPRTWMRRRTQPVWKRAARTAACVLLACTVAFGALMAASPTVRAAVSTWLRQITQEGRFVKVMYTLNDPNEIASPLPWRLTWLPEGWTLADSYIDESIGHWTFEIIKDDGWSNQLLTFNYTSDYTFHLTSASDFAIQERVSVHGRPADYYKEGYYDRLFWEEVDGALLSIDSKTGVDSLIDWDTLKQVAESAAPWTGVPAEYEVGWMPEGYTDPVSVFSGGVGEWTWIRNHTTLELHYVNDPLRPFQVPSRTPEEVTVNGLPGLFWPSVFSREECDARVADLISDPNSLLFLRTEEAAVLTWEDPATNTIFRFRGMAEKEELLRMAESVTKKSS